MDIQLTDFRMAYTDTGSGLPLLLVHGYPLNRRMWQPQVLGLTHAVRVLAPDLRGHGDSQAVPGPYSVEALADDLAALLDGLNIQTPVVLCGLSMGGYIAFAFYRKYASRLAGLILTATRAAADSPEARLGRDQAADRARQEGVNAIAAAMLPRLLAPQTYNERPELVQQVKEIMESTSLEGILGDLAALKQRPDSTPTLPKIRVPTLILHGQQDALIPLQEAQAMQAGIPGARLIAIPGAGHLPNLEQPELFNRAVIEFLQSL